MAVSATGMDPQSSAVTSASSGDDVHVVSFRGLQAAAEGVCVFFVRTHSEAISVRGVSRSIMCGTFMFNAIDTMNLLLTSVFLPLMKNGAEDDVLTKSPFDDPVRADFAGAGGGGGGGVDGMRTDPPASGSSRPGSRNCLLTSLMRLSVVLADVVRFDGVRYVLSPPRSVGAIKEDAYHEIGIPDLPSPPSGGALLSDSVGGLEVMEETGMQQSLRSVGDNGTQQLMDAYVVAEYERVVSGYMVVIATLLDEESHYAALHASAAHLATMRERSRTLGAHSDGERHHDGEGRGESTPAMLTAPVERSRGAQTGSPSQRRKAAMTRLAQQYVGQSDAEDDAELSRVDQTLSMLIRGVSTGATLSSIHAGLGPDDTVADDASMLDPVSLHLLQDVGDVTDSTIDGSALVSLVMDGWADAMYVDAADGSSGALK